VSWSPCLNCRRTGNGALRFAYINSYEERVLVQQRVALCGACWDGLLADALEVSDTKDASGRWVSQMERGPDTPLAVSISGVALTTSASTSARTTASRRTLRMQRTPPSKKA